MEELKIPNRLTFLAEMFDVFELEKETDLAEKISQLEKDDFNCEPIGNKSNVRLKGEKFKNIIAIISTKLVDDKLVKKISVSSNVFSEMIKADPTVNKIFLQWLLNVFSHMLKEGTEQGRVEALRFVSEDLPQANQYLVLFEANKRKKKFLTLCKSSYSLVGVEDPTNINQYKSLSQLFEAVDPFIEKEPSAVERTLKKFVDAGQAIIPVKDRKYTLYIPLTRDASVVFDKFASWCTARQNNGMFDSYTTGNKKPNGENSNIYIIINNKFFTKETDEMFQIHFETDQIRNRNNSGSDDILKNVLDNSDALKYYFKSELMGMAKAFREGIDNNKYLNYLLKFGFSESLFEMMDSETTTIRFTTKVIKRMPDLSRFKDLQQLVICNAKLDEIHPSIGLLKDLELLVFNNNNITTIPSEIGMLKKLEFLNLIENEIVNIPEEIKYLDKSNGGSLYRIAITKSKIGEKNYDKLKQLLPSAEIY